jgi:hypothetical protein
MSGATRDRGHQMLWIKPGSFVKPWQHNEVCFPTRILQHFPQPFTFLFGFILSL